ncbi:MAG: endonuclease/exonuclease/phosphatase, partial [Planctomycetota bacterium]
SATWDFLVDVCKHFDLLAVQEVSDNLEGVRHLESQMGSEFGLIVSDGTGAFPGSRGLTERMAFIFNWSMVHRKEIATDVTYDRSKLLLEISKGRPEINAAFDEYEVKLTAYKNKERKTKPMLKMPKFLSFIRSPFCVAFQVTGHPGTQPYEFMAINAHLFYGNYMSDRWQEFDALMDWIIARVGQGDKAYYPNFILLGDLNLDFDEPKKDMKRMIERLKSFNDKLGNKVNVNFPFLDKHKGQSSVFKTNSRLNQTYDQIGLFCTDPRFPDYAQNESMGDNLQGPDFGVFNFVELFSKALYGKKSASLTKAQKKMFYSKFEHSVSDHLPLWVRLPLP